MEKQSKKRTKKIILIILSAILALAILLAVAFFFMFYKGKSQFHGQDSDISTVNKSIEINEDEDTVDYNGETYKLNEDIISFLVVGVDKKNIDENIGYGENGQADAIFVATVNTKTKKIKVIPIPRETMVDVNIYSKSGIFAETKREQLCLAYAYGNTAESSAENVMRSVKRALYGINISSYITMDLDCVSKLSSAVGGVSVTCLETLSWADLYEGKTYNLKGQKAVNYIQSRGSDALASSRRLARQKQFLSAFISKAGNLILSDFSNIKKLYDTAKPYISTDMSFSQITYLATSYISKDAGKNIEYASVSGEYKIGEKWVEFEQNEDDMIKTVMETFYEKVD